MEAMKFNILRLTAHDPKGVVVDSSHDEETAERIREKLDEKAHPSELAFFVVVPIKPCQNDTL
jgi:hypothetical protein